MRTKVALLHSVSAIATAAAATTGQAQAQVIAPTADGYSYTVGGGLLFSPAEMSLAGLEEDKLGSAGITETSLDDFTDHFGYNAFFSVGKQIDNTWDVRFGGSINKLLDSTGSLTWSGGGSGSSAGAGSGSGNFSSYSYGSFGTSGGRESFSFASMDFEVGYTPVLTETMSVRLFAGIRGLHFSGDSDSNFSWTGFNSNSFDSNGSGSGGSYFSETFEGTANTKTEFFGVGPRVGVSAAHRFEGTNFGLSGTLAGSVLFGRQTTTTNSFASISGFSSYFDSSGGSGSGPVGGSDSYSDSSSFNYSFSVDKMVVDLEAKVGVDYYLNDSTALTIGYQAEKLLNVGPGDDSDDSRLVHGPFLKLSGSL